HLKWPWPIERVAKVDATSIKNFNDTVPVLTRDENIVTVEVNVQYRVDDPILYLFGTRNADEVLQQATLSAVREQVGRSDLDTVLSARSALSVSARERLQAALGEYQTGLIVTELNLPNARPPEEVKPAFDDVNSAQQDKERLENEAEAYASKIVPEARGQAARVRTEAEGYKTAAIAEATGDAERFSLLLDAHRPRRACRCRGALQPAAGRLPPGARSAAQAAAAGEGRERAGRQPHQRRRRRQPADLRADGAGPGVPDQRRDAAAAHAGDDLAD